MKKFLLMVNLFIITLCTVMFVGCGEDFSKFALHFSSDSIKLSLGEEQTYDISVENYFETQIDFDFNFDKNIAQIDKTQIENLKDGTFRIKVKSLMSGSTTLTITLLQGNKTLLIPVDIYEPINSFALKTDLSLYVLRGESITFSSDMFNFYPMSNVISSQKQLTFSYEENVLDNNTFVATQDSPDVVTITATSVFNPNLNVNFQVKVLNKITLVDTSLSLDDNVLQTVEENPDSYIQILTNDENEFKKTLTFSYQANSIYQYEVLSEKNALYIETYQSSDYENTIFIDIQHNNLKNITSDNLIIRVSYKDYDAYYVDLSYRVEMFTVPQNIKINGQKEYDEIVDLFDNQLDSTKKEVLLSVDPSNATYDTIKISFLIAKTNPSTLETTYTNVDYETIKQYICVTYNGVEIQNEQEIDNLSIPVVYYGRAVMPASVGDYICIRFECISQLTEKPVYNEIKVVVHKSATNFYVDSDKYQNSTIYLKNGDEVEFDGFVVVEPDAYIGKITAIPDFLNSGYVEVSQVADNVAKLKIKALKVGTANYTLILSSGISTRIKIVVKEELNISDFMLYISSVNSDAVAEVTYKNVLEQETLNSVALRGINAEFEVSSNIDFDLIDDDMYSFSLVSENNDVIQVGNNNRIKALVADDNVYTITVTLNTKKIENFALVDDVVNNTDYSFTVTCFNPISSFLITGLNSGDMEGEYSSQVDVYDVNTVGYLDRLMSEVTFKLYVDGKELDSIQIANQVEWDFSISYEWSESLKAYILTESGSITYGYFYPNELKFVCDAQGEPSGSFKIEAIISEYGKHLNSTVQINVEEYVKVDGVWLENYMDQVYLDSINKEVILYPYIMPNNATNKNYVVWFEPSLDTSSSVVQLEYNSDYIKLKYSGVGGGSGILHIVPTSKYIDDYGNYDYSLDIEVKVGDGTQNNPLHISSWEEFKKIDLSKYYVLDSIIDAGNEAIEPLGELTGGIKGVNVINGNAENVGGIVNLNIKLSKDVDGSSYYGLFTKVAQNALISNLTISGHIEIDSTTKHSYIGVICGENNGVIKNVSITLSTSDVYASGDYQTYLGAVCGKNNGLIITDINQRQAGEQIKDYDNEKRVNGELIDNISVESTNGYINEYYESYAPASTLMVYMPEGELFNLKLSNGGETYYFGGIAGYNNGLVKFRYDEEINKYNYYGTSCVVYLDNEVYNQDGTVVNNSINASYVGGAVGYNENGNIVNLLVSGIVDIGSKDNVGGLVGAIENGKILNNTARVFVRGKDYVAGLVGQVSAGVIEDNKVQAIDTRTKIGEDASLIISNFGTKYDAILNAKNTSTPTYTENIAETYFKRTVVTYGTAMNLANYYGDIVQIETKEGGLSYTGKQFDNGSNIQTLDSLFNIEKYPNKTIVLMYYKAVDSTKQTYIEKYNTQNLPSDIFDDNVEVSMQSSATSVISISAQGQLVLNSTGYVEITITSLLNYDDKITLRVIVTNYISGLELYTTPDRIGTSILQTDVISLSNRNSFSVYPKFQSEFSAGNTIIETVENQNVKLEIVGNDYVKITQSGSSIILTGNGSSNSEQEKIEYYIYLNVAENDKRYLTKVNGDYVFVTEKDQSNFELTMKYTQGIYSISLDKINVTVVPSDTIKLRVEYYTDDVNDVLSLYVSYKETGEYITDNSTIQYYFNITKSNASLVSGESNKYYIDYVISMNTDNRIRTGEYQFIFSGSDGMAIKVLNVNYLSQPLTSVIVKNYSFADNENIVIGSTPEGNVIYNTSYTMQETDTITAGEVNILRTVVMPEFADYSYIEITNADSNIQSGKIVLFGLLQEYQNADQAIVSSEGYFTANGIRVLKSSIKGGDLKVLYRLATNVVEGDSVTLNINFYNENGEIVYSQQQKVLTIAINKTIDVSISNKEAKDETSTSKSYYVARGYSYALNVSSVGYNENEIVIECNSPYGTITKENGIYYLQISDSINYISNQEGVDFTITYYGRRVVNGQTVESSKKFIVCTVVEYVLESLDIKELFSDNNLVLSVKNAVDIRDYMIDKLEIEHSSNAQNAVEQLKQSLKENATFYYKVSDTYEFLTSTTTLDNQYVTIKENFEVIPNYVGENLFQFGISATLQYSGGYIKVVNEQYEDVDITKIKEFNVVVNQRTSEESAFPIYDLEDLLNMSAGNYYVLMDDIVIPSNFNPIDVDIKKLDGNNNKIIFTGNYGNYQNVNQFGLFKQIYQDTVIENLIIDIQGNGTVMMEFNNLTSTSPLIFGLLTAQNNGTITNCMVTMSNLNTALKVTNSASISATNTSYVSGFVGTNNGYITNCRVSVKIESSGANLAGFVAVNNGHVSSSYVTNSLIRNSSTNVNNSTGGFVTINNGKIILSYIEGKYSEGVIYMYADDGDYIVRASSIAGAFAYSNSGEISDSYANIPVISSSRNSGFVCINDGQISRCYTTSKLGDKDTENYPFFITNSTDAIIEHCYFLKDTNFNVNINQSNDNLSSDVLRATTLAEFATGYVVENNIIQNEKLFSEFIINTNGDKNKGVWFYPTDNDSKTYNVSDTINPSEFEYSKYIACESYVYNGTVQQFVANRPQLVSANLLAYSKVEIDTSNVNEETGEIIYTYKPIESIYASEGSIYNPIIIYSATQLEAEIINGSYKDENSLNYRIVRDIDYSSEGVVVSNLYRTVITGYIEGNGLKISGFSINTNESLYSGGFFAQIGNSSTYATIQNLTFVPKYINLPNAYNVGTVAGTVQRAYVYNITVDGYSQNSDGIVILGRDIVGGVFGITNSAFDIQNISSSASANAYLTYMGSDWTSESAQNEILYEEIGGDNSKVAYSGGVIGYVGGQGKLQRVSINSEVASIGMVSGLMFGGIGRNVEVSDITLMPIYSDKNFVRASAYGGLIAGDVRGKLTNVVVEQGEDVEGYDLFKLEPRIPIAIGGIAGIVRNGTISNCTIYENVVVDKSLTVKVVGGIAGKVLQSATFENCYVYGDVQARQAVGAVVGELVANQTANVNVIMSNIIVGSTDSYVTLQLNKPATDTSTIDVYVGGLIGVISGYNTDGEALENNKLSFKDIKLYTNLTSKTISVYGTSGIDADSINYNVWAGGLIGGYENVASSSYWASKITLSSSQSTNKIDIYTNINLTISNLRNGLDDNGIAKEFNTYLSWLNYKGLNTENINFDDNLNYDILINGKAFSFNSQTPDKCYGYINVQTQGVVMTN